MKNNKIIEVLKWDSSFFDIRVGKIELTERNFDKDRFLDEQKKEQFDLIYGFSDASQTPNGFWESLNFRLIDCRVTMSRKFDPSKYKNLNYEQCLNLPEEEIKSCYKIAETIAPFSRFYKAPTIGPALTKKMYREWVNTALDGSFSDCLFVERIEDKIVGIHAIRTENNIGVFTLTGVKKEFLKQGIGRKLWDQSFGYWSNHAHQVNLIRSKFSIRNIASFDFHIAMGFDKIESFKYIYHYSKPTLVSQRACHI